MEETKFGFICIVHTRQKEIKAKQECSIPDKGRLSDNRPVLL